MKEKIIAAFASLALVMGGLVYLAFPSTASAQVYPKSVTCEARSPSAYGVWTHVNGRIACERALRECAIRTPAWQTCHTTRWWYNY